MLRVVFASEKIREVHHEDGSSGCVGFGCFFFLQSALSDAADWPLYRGPNQDGISPEKVDIQWSGDGPKVVWRTPTNTGFSSFAVSDGKVFTQVVREINGKPREICLALDAATGKELWFADIAAGRRLQRRRHGRRRRRSAVHAYRQRRQGLPAHARPGHPLPRCQHGPADLETRFDETASWAEHRLEQRRLRGRRWQSGLRRRRRAGRIDAGPEQEHRRGRLEDRRRDDHPLHARGGHDPRASGR